MGNDKDLKLTKCVVLKDDSVPFNNKSDFCVGTGRMGLALQKEYYDQLQFVQENIGFKYIRGHGLFADDMAIYQEYTNEDGEICVEYNYTYLDLVMDSYKSVGIKPFLELGFMPAKLASGEQTVFYWKGNTTPPKSYEGWCNLVTNTLCHLIDRYGEDEVITWPVEVWNEPNLGGFWKGADMEEYFKLFEYTFNAVKSVNQRFRVGGPAICGVNDEEWIGKFMEFCHTKKIPVDFITRHHYTTEMPDVKGHYSYQALSSPQYGVDNLHKTREIVDSFEEYRNSEIHITEYNTSYTPDNPIHDTNQNAAYIAHQLSWLGDDNASYSYWTFGDIFEERGVPFTPFYGGFGMVANGVIPKPTFWTFEFFKQLKGDCVLRTNETVMVKHGNGYRGVIWNSSLKRCGKKLESEFSIETDAKDYSEYCVVYKIVDENTCNPLKLWHDLGEPASLSDVQKKLLRSAAVPLVKSENLTVKSGKLDFTVSVEEFGVVYFEITTVNRKSDRGYSFDRVMKGE